MDELFFITFNGFGQMLSIVNNAISGFAECETNTVINLGSLRIYLMIVAGIILGIIFSFIVFYVISVDKTLNTMWELLRKSIHQNYTNTKQLLLERLSEYHNSNDVDTEFDSIKHKTSTPLHFLHSLRYLLRLSVIFVFVAIFFALTSSYFFENIYDYMYYKPRLIHTIIQRRLAMTEILFYVYENEIQGTDKSLSVMFPQFNLFNDPVGLYIDAYNLLGATKHVIIEPNIIKLISPALVNYLFWKCPTCSDFQAIGIYPASAFFMFESHFTVFNDEVDSPQVIAGFAGITISQTNALEVVFTTAGDDSKDKINVQLQTLIDFIGFFCIFIVGVYTFYYRSYFNSEKEVLENIMEMITILPSNQAVCTSNISRAMY